MQAPTLQQRLDIRNEPTEMPVMYQKWRDFLFIHWEVDPGIIQKTLPPGLYTDTFDGKAFIGVIPFSLFDVRPVLIPSISGISNFLEVNVRTYVYDENGTPGVWFYSLDANQLLAVEAAKMIALPYVHSDIELVKTPGSSGISFKLKRKNVPQSLSSQFIYSLSGPEMFAQSDSLEFFLIERYMLFAYSRKYNKMYKIRIHHLPYPLKTADVSKYDSNLLFLNDFTLNSQPVHFTGSTGVDVKIYKPDNLF